MLTIRMKARIGALLAATALGAPIVGAVAPASASGNLHTVTVRVSTTTQGWTASLSCTPAGGGTVLTRSASAVTVLNLSTLAVYQQATFTDVPNASCTVTAASAGLLGVGAASAAQSGVTVTANLVVTLTPTSSTTVTVPTTTTPVTSSDPATTTPVAAPTVSGKAAVGGTLVASPAEAPAGASVTGYQWYVKRVVGSHARGSRVVLVRIKGAHHRRLHLKERLAGKHVLVGVTYTIPGAAAATAYSPAVKVHLRLKEGW